MILNGLDGLCSGVRTGLSIQIATALNGNVQYPSRTVEYIAYNWTRTVDVNNRVSSNCRYDIVVAHALFLKRINYFVWYSA